MTLSELKARRSLLQSNRKIIRQWESRIKADPNKTVQAIAGISVKLHQNQVHLDSVQRRINIVITSSGDAVSR